MASRMWLMILAAASSIARAQPVLITGSTVINPGATTIVDDATGRAIRLETADIDVEGGQLEINGEHRIASLTVGIEPGGWGSTVTHGVRFIEDRSDGTKVYGMRLTVDRSVRIGPNAMIAAGARGFGIGEGPGAAPPSTCGLTDAGAGHGHRGRSTACGRPGGMEYGSLEAPREFGSGGGLPDQWGGLSGGGGCIELCCGGTVTVDGSIDASGGGACGGSSGGSVRLVCDRLEGAGVITADGGRDEIRVWDDGAGGAGGRIAVEYNTSTFSGRLSTKGGSNGLLDSHAAPGTVLIKAAGHRPTLRIENPSAQNQWVDISCALPPDVDLSFGGVEARLSTPVAILGDLLMDYNTSVTAAEGIHSVSLSVGGDLTVPQASSIRANGCGFEPGQGPSPGDEFVCGPDGRSRIGAGHGGNGSENWCTGTCSAAYGSYAQPETLGSGGLISSGGGAIRLIVGGSLCLAGDISADGQWQFGEDDAGSAGGSIWITAAKIAGAPDSTISADGGAGGAGGRIAVEYEENLYAGRISADAGYTNFGQSSGAGTVFLKPGDRRGTLIVGEGSGRTDLLLSDSPYDVDLLVGYAHVGVPAGARILGDVRVVGTVTPAQESEVLWLTVDGNLSIEYGRLRADALGYAWNQGPGAGRKGDCGESFTGASHGGSGGTDPCQEHPAPAYGSVTKPTMPGSGGYMPSEHPWVFLQGRGGGVIDLTVGGTLSIAGSISADAGSLTDYWLAHSGSAGGSIVIRAARMTSAGPGSQIRAVGAGLPMNTGNTSGGGAGGRIAIFSCENLFPYSQIRVDGGWAAVHGSAGTIFYGTSSIEIDRQPESVSARSGFTTAFSVDATSNQAGGILAYQWRRLDESGEYFTLTDGGGIEGSQTPTLTLRPVRCSDAGVYDCFISDACGGFPSASATLKVQPGADYDGSGQVDLEDLAAFLGDFRTGADRADVDGTGFVDTDDFTAFVISFQSGC